MRILVVDDDVEILRPIAKVLTKAGHEVHTATSALGAVEMLRRHDFHLALIDYELGSPITGVDVAKHAPRGTALIMITGHDPKEMRGEIADPLAPFLEIIGKPFTTDDIIREVARVQRMNDDTNPS